MTIHQTPRDVLKAFSPKLGQKLPPPRFTEDDSLLVEIRDKIAKAENIATLRPALRALLGESLVQMGEEDAARSGLIGVLHPDIE
jgi:hypothetical protein